MSDPRKELALQIIEKAKEILADLPDPQVMALKTYRYEALGHTEAHLDLKIGKRKFSVTIEEDLPKVDSE